VLRTRRFGSLLAVALVATPLSSTTTHATTIRAQPVAANLRVPVTFAPAPDGRISTASSTAAKSAFIIPPPEQTYCFYHP